MWPDNKNKLTVSFDYNNVSVHTITILRQWLHYSFPSFRGQQPSFIKVATEITWLLPAREPYMAFWSTQSSAVMGTLQKRFCSSKNFFLFLNWPSLMTSRAIKVENILISQTVRKIKEKVLLTWVPFTFQNSNDK